MLRDKRYKLIYYPVGNRLQLFDLAEDPDEMRDLSESGEHQAVRERLSEKLIKEMYAGDLEWVKDGKLVGLADKKYEPAPNRRLNGQRGWRFM